MLKPFTPNYKFLQDVLEVRQDRYTSNFKQLKSNVELNNIESKIKIYKKILSNKSEKMKMWVPDKNKTGGFSVYEEKDQEIKKYDTNNRTKVFNHS